MKNKFAFSLQEILLTTAIIGVVATLSMSMLNSKNNVNKELLLFRKAYEETTRIVNDMINDENLYPNAETSGLAYKPEGTAYNIHYYFLTNFARAIGVKGDVNKPTIRITSMWSNSYKKLDISKYHFESLDGMFWALDAQFTESGSSPKKFYVDVNGNEGDNCYPDGTNFKTCKKPDRFTIYVNNNGKVYVDNKNTATGHYGIEYKYLLTKNITRPWSEIKNENY